MTSTVKTSPLAKDYKEKDLEEVNYNGGFDDTKQAAVGKTTEEDKEKKIKESAAISITHEYDYNSSDDDDSFGGSYDEADSEDYISDDDDDGLINNKADGLVDLDEFRRNNPTDADIYYKGWDGLFVPELDEGGTVVLPPSFVL